MAKILLVEDDTKLVELLKDWFAKEGHILEVACTGGDAKQLLNAYEHDVIILDWELPDTTGIQIAKEYRQGGGDKIILFLTGKGAIENKEAGLEFADDYLTKPFEIRELSARIKSLLRRPSGLLPVEIRIGNVSLVAKSHTLVVGEQKFQLRAKESALLEYLMRHPNCAFDSRALLDAVWPSESGGSTETVRTWMKTLRKTLAEAGREDLIKTIAGSGYMIEFEGDRNS